MFKPPAHRSGTAGCINMHADAGPLTRQIDEYYERRQSMNTTQRGKLAAAVGREGLQEALKADEAPTPLVDWESRYNGLVEALTAYLDSRDTVFMSAQMLLGHAWSYNLEIRKILEENT